MRHKNPDVIKSSGEKVKFSFSKLRNSLLKSGATRTMVAAIIEVIKKDLHQNISTKELYQRAFQLLKEYKGAYASRYKLKKAIYELGPSGFPFERFVAEVLKRSGYKIKLNQTLQGKCVSHEVDIVGENESGAFLMECKFHSEEGRKCDVKVPLYIHSRFEDINALPTKNGNRQGWLVTNTQFTKDAIEYGECAGLKMLSWDHPVKMGLKEMIDRYKTYPITTSTLLTAAEKKMLLTKGIVLGRELLDRSYVLDSRTFSENRKERILNEFGMLCNSGTIHGK